MSRTEIFADGIRSFIDVHRKFPKSKTIIIIIFIWRSYNKKLLLLVKPEGDDYSYMAYGRGPGGSSLANSFSIFIQTILN